MLLLVLFIIHWYILWWDEACHDKVKRLVNMHLTEIRLLSNIYWPWMLKTHKNLKPWPEGRKTVSVNQLSDDIDIANQWFPRQIHTPFHDKNYFHCNLKIIQLFSYFYCILWQQKLGTNDNSWQGQKKTYRRKVVLVLKPNSLRTLLLKCEVIDLLS